MLLQMSRFLVAYLTQGETYRIYLLSLVFNLSLKRPDIPTLKKMENSLKESLKAWIQRPIPMSIDIDLEEKNGSKHRS